MGMSCLSLGNSSGLCGAHSAGNSLREDCRLNARNTHVKSIYAHWESIEQLHTRFQKTHGPAGGCLGAMQKEQEREKAVCNVR